MSRTRKAAAVSLSAAICASALVGGLAGVSYAQDDNGVAGESAPEIITQAREAFEKAPSMRVNIERTGVQKGDVTHTDLAMDREGNCKGTATFEGEGGFEIIKSGERLWFKPDAAWIKAQIPGKEGTEAADELAGKYLEGTTKDKDIREVAAVCDIGVYQEAVRDGVDAPLRKHGTTTVNGTHVVELTGREEGKQVTLDVATTGEPYPVRISTEGPGDEGETTAITYGEQVRPEAPPAADTVPWEN
ncbi:hypothetical protein G5C51_34500 [Streptomyces sp. A7024]|uniref:Lipoprotein n=1 Tax=Streptomyces coryli TaxID=1128680 RepID=A0A6G4UCC7_9ACTN|nr:hypothetical protein [Streptomyces coryli]NGN68987.1 hypothetical protein [Streptomyces coryli]